MFGNYIWSVRSFSHDTVKSQSDDLPNPNTSAPFNGRVSQRWYFVSYGCNVASHLSNCTEYIHKENVLNGATWKRDPLHLPLAIEIYSSIDDEIDSYCSHLY